MAWLAAAAASVGAAPVVIAGGVALAAVSAGAAALASGAERPAHWVPDSARPACSGCSAAFGAVTRRHHETRAALPFRIYHLLSSVGVLYITISERGEAE